MRGLINNKLKQVRENNKGFSLVELVVVIAIMVTLSVGVALAVTGHVEKAKEAQAQMAAKTLFDAAQVAIMQASQNTGATFRYAVKFEQNIDGTPVRMGRFSSQSLYKYIKESGGSTSLSGAKSKPTDYYIAAQLVNALPSSGGDIAGTELKDKSPIGASESVKYMSDHPEIYGNVVFGMAYDGSGDIIYFQCVYDGYFYEFDGTNFSGKKVDDATKFNDWPKTRASGTDGW